MNIVLPKGDRTEALLRLSILFNQLDRTRAWIVDWKPYRKTRTDAQNHALWGVAYPTLSAETGYSKDELHEAFCKRMWGTVDRDVMGVVVSKPFRTTTRDERGKRDVISWDLFADFYDLVERTAAEAGILIPPPDQQWRTTAPRGPAAS